ncbi:MAG: helix-turn-helix domain-containing protein [Steroidobacteraceae bacterium]
MTEGHAEAEGRGPGAMLAAARVSAGLTLSQVAEKLHLDLNSVSALEADRLEVFGAEVFALGHLQRYARLMGLPLADIDVAYAACTRPLWPEVEWRYGARSRIGVSRRPRRARVKVAWVVVLIVGLAWFAWWALHSAPHSRNALSARPLIPVPSSPRLPEPPVTGRLAVTAPTGPPSPAAPLAGAAAAAPSVASAAGTGSVQLSVQFTQDSWVEVYDAAGARRLYALGKAGSRRVLSAQPPLRVVLGNPEGVTLTLDHRIISLGRSAHIKPLRFSIDRAGRIVVVRARARDPAPVTETP